MSNLPFGCLSIGRSYRFQLFGWMWSFGPSQLRWGPCESSVFVVALQSLAFPSHDPSRTTLRGGGGAAKTASIQNSMLSTPKLPYFQILSSSSPPCTVAHTYIHTSFQPTNPFVGFPPPLVSPHAVLIPRTTSPPSFLAPRIRSLPPLSPHTPQCTERDHPR